jgi:hypothetical protein
MMRKLGIFSVVELVRLAVEAGIIPSDLRGISGSE